MEEMNRARYKGRGAELLGSLRVSHFPQISSVSSPTWSYSDHSFRFFVRLLTEAWMTKSLAIVDGTHLQLLPLPSQEVRAKLKVLPLITRWVASVK